MRFLWLAILPLVFPAFAAGAEPFSGRWAGMQRIGPESQPVELTIQGEQGHLQGHISFPVLGFSHIPLTEISAKGKRLMAKYRDDWQAGSFSLRAGDNKLTGTLERLGCQAQVELRRAPQPLHYTEEKIRFDSGGVTLAGTILMPPDPGPHPGIVLVDGSGDTVRSPQYWYGEFFTRLGVACLFYDKRGSGESGGNWREADFEALAGDVNAAVARLRQHSALDAKRVGLWGISQAGWVMPIAAARGEGIAFMVVVSGGAVTVEREGYWDAEYVLPRKGYGPEIVAKAKAYIALDNEVTRTGENWEALRSAYEAYSREPWFKDARLRLPVAKDFWVRPWYRKIMDIDHRPFVEGLRMPVLWLYGEEDDTFPAPESEEIVRAIGNAQSHDFSIHRFPRTGHGMRIAPAKDSGFTVDLMNPEYLAVLKAWLCEKVMRGAN